MKKFQIILIAFCVIIGIIWLVGVNQDESLNLKKEYAIPVNLVAELDFEEGDARPIANTDSIIVKLSHQEKAWKKLEANRELIGYQDYAFEFKAL
jgi:hypothetical protein